MPYVKLDCGMLQSSLWGDRDAREIFITALLMARPAYLDEPMAQIEVDSLKSMEWKVPPGWYGWVDAAGVAIIRAAQVPDAAGFEALRRLGSPEKESRSQAHEGRRLVRVDGGYVVLNYMTYREKDKTAAERSRLYRQRKKFKLHLQGPSPPSRVAVTPSRVIATQAEAEAEYREGVGVQEPLEGTRPPANSPPPTPSEAQQVPTADDPITNKPTLDQAIRYFEPSDYTQDEVRACYRTFEATKGSDGSWWWGKRLVGDWRAAMEQRMAETRTRNPNQPLARSSSSILAHLAQVSRQLKANP